MIYDAIEGQRDFHRKHHACREKKMKHDAGLIRGLKVSLGRLVKAFIFACMF